jgi:signal transduction histidine kinase
MTLAMPANDPMDPMKERLVNGLASQAGLALQNVRLVQDLRASRRRIVAAQDERAKRLERNIHDGAQQQLVALAVQLKLARTVLDRDPEKAAELLDALQGTATSALEDLRDLARGIYPPLLADKGLAAALEAQTRKTAVPATVACEGIGRYTPEIEAAVYFCTLEALTNVAKYAAASRVEVRLAQLGGELAFEVADDGAGFDTAAATHGTGRQGMADRLEAIGGSLTVTSAPGEGTVVRGRIPVVSVT